MNESTEYKRKGIINIDEIPGWVRRPHRWDDLVEDVLSLEPGQAVVYNFPSVQEARRASNSVRDRANRDLREKYNLLDRQVSTRIVPEDNSFDLHLKLEKKETESKD